VLCFLCFLELCVHVCLSIYVRVCVCACVQMLVYFFSDRNYVRAGFYAHYSISACRQNCSGHGECLSDVHRCRCFPGYIGAACEQPLCAEACDRHGGRCSEEDFSCVCPAGHVGYDCGLSVDPYDDSNVSTWSQVLQLNPATYTPRAGHASVAVNDCLYVFGGTTLNDLLNNLLVFCVSAPSSWQTVARSEPWPAPRYGHAMCAVDMRIFLYGGVLSDGNSSSELWEFDIPVGRWKMINTSSSVHPPALSGHTLTPVDAKWLYVVGGRTSDGECVSDVHVAGISTGVDDVRWQRVRSRGGREARHRLVGHTTVFHNESRSLLVFGGFSPESARFPRRLALLLSFHVDARRWLSLSYDSTLPSVPRERAYHTAVIVGNYMMIHGGQVHVHHEDETCYDSQIYVYHLFCHVWVDFISLVDKLNGLFCLYTLSLITLLVSDISAAHNKLG